MNKNNRKTIYSMLILTIFTLLLITISTCVAEKNQVLGVDDVSISGDDSVVGSVYISGDVVDLGAFQFSLSWDPSVVSVVDVETSGSFGSVNSFVDDVAGVLNVNWFDVGGVSGDLLYVVNVTFERAGSAGDGDVCSLSFSNDLLADVSGNVFDYGVDGGVVTINDDSQNSGGTDGGGNGGGTGVVQNSNPNAVIITNTITASAGEAILFNASGSTDPDGDSLTYLWDFKDGSTSTDEVVTHRFYLNSGQTESYNVTLTVNDGNGGKDTSYQKITIISANNPPEKPVINGNQTGHKNVPMLFNVSSVDLDNDTIQYIFDWDDGNTNETQFYPSGEHVSISHSWLTAGKYSITLYSSDNKSQSQTVSYTVYIDAIQVGDIGVLIDEDGDDVFDIFYNETSQKKNSVSQKTDETYLIDDDGDEQWDYTFNTSTEQLDQYGNEDENTEQSGFDSILTLLVMVIVIIIVVIYFSSRKSSKSKGKEKKTKKKK